MDSKSLIAFSFIAYFNANIDSSLYFYVSALISCLVAFSLDYVGSMSPQKIIFSDVYLLEDEQELSLGMLIRLKRICNFCQFHALFMTLLHVYLHFHIFYNIFRNNLLIQCPVPLFVRYYLVTLDDFPIMCGLFPYAANTMFWLPLQPSSLMSPHNFVVPYMLF